VSATADSQSANLLRAAAEADLAVFRRTEKWPSTSVSLRLKVADYSESASTDALAHAVTSLDDLVLVAAPGMGKTTTLFQIAESMLADNQGTPLVVPLGDWATEDSSILDSVLKRPAFRGISDDDFRAVAANSGVVLLLDGWNELDSGARDRARVQVANLKAELPELGLVVSTRKQALDVPFVGTRIDLLPLSEEQQLNIATAMRREAGAKILDQAWRTAGVRELMTIPLYLTTLLSLPENAPFPKTKEEVLRHFVAAHEEEARCAEALRAVVGLGLQQSYLVDLAVFAIQTSSTAIADSNARRSISATATLLLASGQIAAKPPPDSVLEVLVSNHVLMRSGDTPGYSFQHQQFQEWYASHSVESRIVAEIDDPMARKVLKTEVFDRPAWEESILFAIERLARGDAQQRAACGKGILAAFEVDPILAAEMIFRATEEVWTLISPTIQGLLARWHTPGRVDRALRFMLSAGRPEFLDVIWPLITHENEQISLEALRNCRQFRTSILGRDPEKRIETLPPKVRTVLLYEMSMDGGIDGLNLATTVASHDPDPEVKVAVVEALAFRHANRHVDEVLQNADEKVFDLVVRKNLVEASANECVKTELAAARQRSTAAGLSAYDRLRAIVYAQSAEDQGADLASIISEMGIDGREDAKIYLVYEAQNRYPQAVANGLLNRVRTGRMLFYGVDDLLASAGFSLEDEALLQLALAESSRHDDLAEAAASVLGPKSVGRMVDALLEVSTRLRLDGKYDQAAVEAHSTLEDRIAHAPGASLVAAVSARSAQADNEQMARLAGLLSRHPDQEGGRGRPFDAGSLGVIQELASDWGNRMLASGDAKRRQTASIARLISLAPSVDLLPLLKRLLDDELSRYRGFLEEAKAAGWRNGDAVNEARTGHTLDYQRAFLAINGTETASLMGSYLTDEHFGEPAAHVLAGQWRIANEPQKDETFRIGLDLSRVREKRAERIANPDATSAEAEAIFAAIEPMVADSATEGEKRRGVALGVVAARLPHGRREGTIQKLIALSPRRTRSKLLLNLVLSGEEIDIKVVADGVAETFAAAEKEEWILTQGDGYELRDWLRLLPFVNRLADALVILRRMPAPQREPRFLEEMVRALADSPTGSAEELLFELADEDPRFYQNHCWRETALRLGTPSSARRLVDLAANGALQGKTIDEWYLARELSALIGEHPAVRVYVYDLLKTPPSTGALSLLARSVAEEPDEDGLVLLVKLENELQISFAGSRAIQGVVTKDVPIENRKDVYNVVPIPAVELRRKLLAMTSDGGATDAAARCLIEIDEIRDEYGLPEGEPRHPDLASGRPWPMMTIGSQAAGKH
jgi:hypothetical protein